MEYTLVAFHAHPDDESLLTGGTIARVVAEGHRVVVVTATSGEAGLSDLPSTHPEKADLGGRRLRELERAVAALGVARLEVLGYPDSGWSRPTVGVRFCELDPTEPAQRLAEILRAERADVLTTYDANGGYGHPDHLQVHRVGVLAAELAGTPVVLEATIDRGLLQRLTRVMSLLPGVRGLVPADRFASSFTAREQLTHRVDVRSALAAKRAALQAHHSQTVGGAGTRTVAALLRLPGPLLRLVLGREWYVERGRPPGGPLLDDIFATLRP